MSLQVRIYTNYELQQSKNLSGAIPSGAGHFWKPMWGCSISRKALFHFLFFTRLKKKKVSVQNVGLKLYIIRVKQGGMGQLPSVKSHISSSEDSKMARIGKSKNPCVPDLNWQSFSYASKGETRTVMSIVKLPVRHAKVAKSVIPLHPTLHLITRTQRTTSLTQDNQSQLELLKVHWTVCKQKSRAILCSVCLQGCWGDAILICPVTGESLLGSRPSNPETTMRHWTQSLLKICCKRE